MSDSAVILTHTYPSGHTLEIRYDEWPMSPEEMYEGVRLHPDGLGRGGGLVTWFEGIETGLSGLYARRGLEGVERWGRMKGHTLTEEWSGRTPVQVWIDGEIWPGPHDGLLAEIRDYLEGMVYEVIVRDSTGRLVDSCADIYCDRRELDRHIVERFAPRYDAHDRNPSM